MTVIKHDFRAPSANPGSDLSWLRRLVDAMEADIVADPAVDHESRLQAIGELRVAMRDTETELAAGRRRRNP